MTKLHPRIKAAVGATTIAALLTLPGAAQAASKSVYKGSHRGASVEAFYSQAISPCKVRDVHVVGFRPINRGGEPFATMDATVWNGCTGTVESQRFGYADLGVRMTNDRLASATLKGKFQLYDTGLGDMPAVEPLPTTVNSLIDTDAAFALNAVDAITPPPPVTPAQTLSISLAFKAMPGFHTVQSKTTYRNRAAGIRSIHRINASMRDAQVTTGATTQASWGTIAQNKDSWIEVWREDAGFPIPLGTATAR